MKDELTHLGPSPLLDYSHPTLQELIKSKGWKNIRRKADLIGKSITSSVMKSCMATLKASPFLHPKSYLPGMGTASPKAPSSWPF